MPAAYLFCCLKVSVLRGAFFAGLGIAQLMAVG
jgi:hypothetical protein